MTAAEWNRKNPPGTPVRYTPQPGQPAYLDTTTAAAAYSLSTGKAVVRLAGIRGPVPLAQVQAVEAPAVAA